METIPEEDKRNSREDRITMQWETINEIRICLEMLNLRINRHTQRLNRMEKIQKENDERKIEEASSRANASLDASSSITSLKSSFDKIEDIMKKSTTFDEDREFELMGFHY